jgi:signal transduction histidine kinase
MPGGDILAEGKVSFSIESRLLRELGERLVRQPEVALVELIKNAYDADAKTCTIAVDPETEISVVDDGRGMTLDRFIRAWMRIGTSSKESQATSFGYGRPITGEKGIGRFAVRYLGRTLELRSVADDPDSDAETGRTELVARFDWTDFDRNEELGSVSVPYVLSEAPLDMETGTSLIIGNVRSQARRLDMRRIRTESVGLLSPLRSLLREMPAPQVSGGVQQDPGFELMIDGEEDDPHDVAGVVLDNFVVRADIELSGDQLTTRIFRRASEKPELNIRETTENRIGELRADIRFFPRRKGVFSSTPIDGRAAYRWIKTNSGVAVFDRGFRVTPYGQEGDDWLLLAADTARNRRDPRSSLAEKHLAMSDEERSDTSINWMLRLPQSAQLVGLVQVAGHRGTEDEAAGLVAAADREGFVHNDAYLQLVDVVRGAVEGIAFVDRIMQREEEEVESKRRQEEANEEIEAALHEIDENPNLSTRDKRRISEVLVRSQTTADEQIARTKERERQLETVSLLGVVAGFMTHEFGTALRDLRQTEAMLRELADTNPDLRGPADDLTDRIKNLADFTKYATGYIRAARDQPDKPYRARPSVRQVAKVFGDFAAERSIALEIDIAADVDAPLVPPALYSGLVLNLYTNALKAVVASTESHDHRIAFRGWNDGSTHTLEVSDTGIGIPPALRERVFDPLFSTTTGPARGPLGSGMGLGLALVRRAASAYGGRAHVVEPPPGFSTCVRLSFPKAPND